MMAMGVRRRTLTLRAMGVCALLACTGKCATATEYGAFSDVAGVFPDSSGMKRPYVVNFKSRFDRAGDFFTKEIVELSRGECTGPCLAANGAAPQDATPAIPSANTSTSAAPAAGGDTAALIAALQDARDEDTILAAVRKLVTRDEKGVCEALQAAVDRQKDEEVKSHIVVEIAKPTTTMGTWCPTRCPSPRITELLIAIYRKGDNALFTGPAAEALAKIPGEKMAGILAEGLKRQYTECAAAAAADALRTRTEKVVSNALLAALDDFEPTWLIARAHVLQALGGRNEPRIARVLLDNLQNAEDEGIKEACARALALEGDDKVTEALVKTLQTADEYLLREVAALSLGKRGEARQGQPRDAIAAALKKAQAAEKQDRVKKALAKALAQIEKAK